MESSPPATVPVTQGQLSRPGPPSLSEPRRQWHWERYPRSLLCVWHRPGQAAEQLPGGDSGWLSGWKWACRIVCHGEGSASDLCPQQPRAPGALSGPCCRVSSWKAQQCLHCTYPGVGVWKRRGLSPCYWTPGCAGPLLVPGKLWTGVHLQTHTSHTQIHTTYHPHLAILLTVTCPEEVFLYLPTVIITKVMVFQNDRMSPQVPDTLKWSMFEETGNAICFDLIITHCMHVLNCHTVPHNKHK